VSTSRSALRNRNASDSRTASSSSMTWTTPLVGIPRNLHSRPQRETEYGAAAGARPRHDLPAMGLDDGLADRQPDTHALRLGRDKRLEQLRHHLRRDAAPGIGDTDF